MTALPTVPTLETERLILRGVVEADFPAYADFFADEHSTFYGGPVERWEAWRKFATFSGHWVLRGYGPFALEDKATGAFIGVAGPWFPEGWPEPEITWALMLGQTGKGYATEAARRALAFARDTLGWTTAISLIDAQNGPSIALAKRLGAAYERDVVFSFATLGVYRHQPLA